MKTASKFSDAGGGIFMPFISTMFMKHEDLFTVNFAAVFATSFNCMQKLYFKEPRPYFGEDNLDASATCGRDMEYG
jgi:hypothetical protein